MPTPTNSWALCRSLLSNTAILARSVRSGLVESIHRGSVIALDSKGAVAAAWGKSPERFFMRSAAKPFQAAISQEAGAGLSSSQLALASSSHSAEPVHVAMVQQMLEEVGLDESALMCPPAWPGSQEAQRLAMAAGRRQPSRLFNNCSGKHAAMLRACVAQGWPLTYAAPEHPLQQLNANLIAAVIEEDPEPVGVDGCGIPTYRTTVFGLAKAFHQLGANNRFAGPVTSMTRYPALASGTERPEAVIAIATGAATKGGAEGCIGVSMAGQSAVAAKAEDGSFPAAVVGVIEAMRLLGWLTATASLAVAAAAAPPVVGGDGTVGAMLPALVAP